MTLSLSHSLINSYSIMVQIFRSVLQSYKKVYYSSLSPCLNPSLIELQDTAGTWREERKGGREEGKKGGRCLQIQQYTLFMV